MEQFALLPIAGTKNKVLIEIKQDNIKQTSGGILLMEMEPKKNEGIVIAISEQDELGNRPVLSIGDHVFFPEFTATKLVYNQVEYLLLKESDIQAKLIK